MEELLRHLEAKVKEMINQHHRLKHANLQLDQGKHQLLHEKESLLAKQQKAIMQIESLVAKLKTIENYHD